MVSVKLRKSKRSAIDRSASCVVQRHDLFDLERFARMHNLTVAEQRALMGIVSGRSVLEIAALAERSPETIRSQLKRLYAKTRTSGQVELLHRIYDPMFRKDARSDDNP